MTDAVVLAAILGVLGGIVLTVLLLLAWRLARGTADLGSAAERASYEVMHHASLAARDLRGGLSGPDVARAARHFRVLLGSAAVAIGFAVADARHQETGADHR
jgi:two-component system LytT family sensor kinase